MAVLTLKQKYNLLNGGDNEQQNLISQVAINALLPSENLGNESDFTLQVFDNVCGDRVMECPLLQCEIAIFS